jgi:hypothetical protein
MLNYRSSFITLAPGVNVIKQYRTVNYHGNFNPTNSRVKILWQITAVNYRQRCFITLNPGPNVIKLFTALIYCHSMVFTVTIMFYNTE